MERIFIAESSAQRDRAQRDREQRVGGARTRRLQVSAATLAVALLAVAGLAAFGARTRRTAEHARGSALSRQLAEAANRLRTVNPTVAAQLAPLGYRTAPTVEARPALIDTTAAPIARRSEGPGGPVAVASSRNGALLAAVGAGGTIHLWDTSVPAAPLTLPPLRLDGEDTVLHLTFRPDGGSLAAAVSGPNGVRVHVWVACHPIPGVCFANSCLVPCPALTNHGAGATYLRHLCLSPCCGRGVRRRTGISASPPDT